MAEKFGNILRELGDDIKAKYDDLMKEIDEYLGKAKKNPIKVLMYLVSILLSILVLAVVYFAIIGKIMVIIGDIISKGLLF